MLGADKKTSAPSALSNALLERNGKEKEGIMTEQQRGFGGRIRPFWVGLLCLISAFPVSAFGAVTATTSETAKEIDSPYACSCKEMRLHETRHKVYLDHNATTPLLPEVKRAIVSVMDKVGNASALHDFGKEMRTLVEETRGALAHAVGKDSPHNLFFTSGATEANNLALMGFRLQFGDKARLFISSIEHPSVLKVYPNAEVIAVTPQGVIDLKDLEQKLRARPPKTPAFISVMMANNETGIIQPIAEIVKIAKKTGARVHCDAVQAFGKIPFSFDALGVDMMSVSAHKIGGPSGIGALIVRDTVHLQGLYKGGDQESGVRPGTENIIGIAGFKAALEKIKVQDWEKIAVLRQLLESEILKISPKSQIIGKTVQRTPNTSCIVTPGLCSAVQVAHFNREGIAIGAGSACSSLHHGAEPSHVLKAMGVPDLLARGMIRVSLGKETTREDIDRFVEVWKQLRS